jgi:hypothetical protein
MLQEQVPGIGRDLVTFERVGLSVDRRSAANWRATCGGISSGLRVIGMPWS